MKIKLEKGPVEFLLEETEEKERRIHLSSYLN